MLNLPCVKNWFQTFTTRNDSLTQQESKVVSFSRPEARPEARPSGLYIYTHTQIYMCVCVCVCVYVARCRGCFHRSNDFFHYCYMM